MTDAPFADASASANIAAILDHDVGRFVEQPARSEVDGLLRAAHDDDVLAIDRQAPAWPEVSADRLPQRPQAPGTGIIERAAARIPA